MPYTDEGVLRRMAAGDEGAFKMLYDRYWTVLYDKAYQRLKNQQQAEDIVQELFVSLWLRREELSVDNLPAYLNNAVRYRVLNHVLRNKAGSHFYGPFESFFASAQSSDELLLQKELLEAIHAYIATLPEKRREIFLLHFEKNLSTEEISKQLGISQKTVQNQLGTAMQGLRTHITPILLAIISTRF
jgi:RNA polymerase sigma-70 factor (family 1)